MVNDRFIVSEDDFKCWLSSNDQTSTNVRLINNKSEVNINLYISLYKLLIYLLTCILFFKKNKKNGPTSCESNFKAANQIKSLQKSKYLDDTGIFGSICRHGIPLKFLNLRNMGER